MSCEVAVVPCPQARPVRVSISMMRLLPEEEEEREVLRREATHGTSSVSSGVAAAAAAGEWQGWGSDDARSRLAQSAARAAARARAEDLVRLQGPLFHVALLPCRLGELVPLTEDRQQVLEQAAMDRGLIEAMQAGRAKERGAVFVVGFCVRQAQLWAENPREVECCPFTGEPV